MRSRSNRTTFWPRVLGAGFSLCVSIVFSFSSPAYGQTMCSKFPTTIADAVPSLREIDVCKKKWVAGQYVCTNFAIDFAIEAQRRGVPVWTAVFQNPVCSQKHVQLQRRNILPAHGHAMVVIQSEITLSIKEHRQYCLVEPQRDPGNQSVYGCWTQPSTTNLSVPKQITDALLKQPFMAAIKAAMRAGYSHKYYFSDNPAAILYEVVVETLNCPPGELLDLNKFRS